VQSAGTTSRVCSSTSKAPNLQLAYYRFFGLQRSRDDDYLQRKGVLADCLRKAHPRDAQGGFAANDFGSLISGGFGDDWKVAALLKI